MHGSLHANSDAASWFTLRQFVSLWFGLLRSPVPDSARAEHRRWEWSDLLVVWEKLGEETSGAFYSTSKAEFSEFMPFSRHPSPEVGIFF